MKKLFLLPLVTIALLLASCKGDSPAKKTIDVLDSAIEQVSKTDDPKTIYNIMDEAQNKIEEISNKYPDYKPTSEEEAELTDKSVELMNAVINKLTRSMPAVDPTAPMGEEMAGNDSDEP